MSIHSVRSDLEVQAFTENKSNMKDYNDAINEHLEEIRRLHSVHGGYSLNDDLIQVGNQVFRRSELENAYAGDLQPGIHAPRQDTYANPVPLGLSCTAICLMGLALLNMQIVDGVNAPNTMAGAGLFFGGTIQALCGFCCFFTGNTYGMVVLGSYGGFWLSFGAAIIPGFGIIQAYETPADFEYAFGYFLAAFTVFTFLILLCTLKGTWALFTLIFFLFLTFLFLTLAFTLNNAVLKKVAGYFGLFASFAGFYDLYAGLADKNNSYFPLKAHLMPGAPRV